MTADESSVRDASLVPSQANLSFAVEHCAYSEFPTLLLKYSHTVSELVKAKTIQLRQQTSAKLHLDLQNQIPIAVLELGAYASTTTRINRLG